MASRIDVLAAGYLVRGRHPEGCVQSQVGNVPLGWAGAYVAAGRRTAERLAAAAGGAPLASVRRFQLYGQNRESIADLEILVPPAGQSGVTFPRILPPGFYFGFEGFPILRIRGGVALLAGRLPPAFLILEVLDHGVQLFGGQIRLLEWLAALSM